MTRLAGFRSPFDTAWGLSSDASGQVTCNTILQNGDWWAVLNMAMLGAILNRHASIKLGYTSFKLGYAQFLNRKVTSSV